MKNNPSLFKSTYHKPYMDLFRAPQTNLPLEKITNEKKSYKTLKTQKMEPKKTNRDLIPMPRPG